MAPGTCQPDLDAAGGHLGVFLFSDEVDLLHDVEDRFGLERRTVETLLDLGGEASIEGLGLQALDHLAVGIANAHRRNLLDRCRPSIPGQTYV